MDTNKYFQHHSNIPVVVKDKDTGKVLHVAFMNQQALEKTIETGEAWYCSRSNGKLWKKRTEQKQTVVSIYADCDNDSLLMKVHQTGNACHKGKSSCFHRRIWPEND